MRAFRSFLHRAQSHWILTALLAILLVSPSAHSFTTGRDTHPTPANTSSETPQKPQVRAAYDRLPLAFEVNEGQRDPAVRFFAHAQNYALALTPTEALLSPSAPTLAASPASTLHFRFPGANPNPVMQAEQPLPGIVNSFIGNDPAQWRTNIPTAARVRYTALYPGIDLTIYGTEGGGIEYDVIVAPGTEPAAFALSVGEAKGMTLDAATGDLVLTTAMGEVRQHAPAIYQMVGAERRNVAGGYAIRDDGTVGFRVGAYDRTLPLVIDPTLVYSTYLGGSSEDMGTGIAVDTSGSAYVTGYTASTDFPVTIGPPYGGGIAFDAFVTKLDGTGTRVYSTYLGGNGGDRGNAIAVDTNGNAYVTGDTYSTNFPVTSGPPYGGNGDAFVTKFNGAGALVYSTLLGGSNQDVGYGIAVDTFGDAYTTGLTESTNFPVTNGSTLHGGDAFVTKFDGTGTRLYSTYLGGSGLDIGHGIAVDTHGNAYVTGETDSTNFPVTNGSIYGGGATNAFVTKMDGAGTRIYSTYLGGNHQDMGRAITVDTSGNAYVTGSTTSTTFPVTNGSTYGGNGDAFVTKMDGSGTRAYSTYLGGSGDDYGTGIAVDLGGNAYVTGATGSTDFPVTNGSILRGGDAFLSELNGSGVHVYGTYLGGSGGDVGNGIAVDTGGNAYVTGYTQSTNFPVTNGSTYGGGSGDAFVTKIVVVPPLPNPQPRPGPAPIGQPVPLPQSRPTVPVVGVPNPAPPRRP